MSLAFDLIVVAPNGDAWCVDLAAQSERAQRREEARLGEQARIAAVKAYGAAPFECGPEIRVAPARGPSIAFTPRRAEMTEAGPRQRNDGYLGRRAVRRADAFDVMQEQALRAHVKKVRRAPKGTKPPAFVPPFTTGQIEIGRDYAALVERCAASGMKCASLETLRVAASGGGDREAAIFRDMQRLRVLQLRIGDGVARELRRIRPSQRPRTAIRTRYLVDQVCLGERTLSQILAACGWPKKGSEVALLQRALAAALDRMQGYDLRKSQDMA